MADESKQKSGAALKCMKVFVSTLLEVSHAQRRLHMARLAAGMKGDSPSDERRSGSSPATQETTPPTKVTCRRSPCQVDAGPSLPGRLTRGSSAGERSCREPSKGGKQGRHEPHSWQDARVQRCAPQRVFWVGAGGTQKFELAATSLLGHVVATKPWLRCRGGISARAGRLHGPPHALLLRRHLGHEVWGSSGDAHPGRKVSLHASHTSKLPLVVWQSEWPSAHLVCGRRRETSDCRLPLGQLISKLAPCTKALLAVLKGLPKHAVAEKKQIKESLEFLIRRCLVRSLPAKVPAATLPRTDRSRFACRCLSSVAFVALQKGAEAKEGSGEQGSRTGQIDRQESEDTEMADACEAAKVNAALDPLR